MQHCTEVNPATLQKLFETMPQQMHAVAKASPTKYYDFEIRPQFIMLVHNKFECKQIQIAT